MVAFGSAKFNSLSNLPAKGHKRALAVLPSVLHQLTLFPLIFPIPSFNPKHHSPFFFYCSRSPPSPTPSFLLTNINTFSYHYAQHDL